MTAPTKPWRLVTWHPAEGFTVLGEYRWRWTATLAALFWWGWRTSRFVVLQHLVPETPGVEAAALDADLDTEVARRINPSDPEPLVFRVGKPPEAS